MIDCHCVERPGRCLDVRCDICPFRRQLLPKKPKRNYGLVYLATPYSKYPFGIEAAFQDAAALTGRLLLSGITCFSPIAHTHPIATYAGIDPYDHNVWLKFDEVIMAKADTLFIAEMVGWRESYGVQHEIEHFTKAHKPIFTVTPLNLIVAPYRYSPQLDCSSL